jgi:hypothetical protein
MDGGHRDDSLRHHKSREVSLRTWTHSLVGSSSWGFEEGPSLLAVAKHNTKVCCLPATTFSLFPTFIPFPLIRTFFSMQPSPSQNTPYQSNAFRSLITFTITILALALLMPDTGRKWCPGYLFWSKRGLTHSSPCSTFHCGPSLQKRNPNLIGCAGTVAHVGRYSTNAGVKLCASSQATHSHRPSFPSPNYYSLSNESSPLGIHT